MCRKSQTNMVVTIALPFFLVLVCCGSVLAEQPLKLSGIFADHMVLQRDEPIRIWGWAETGDTIRVAFAEQNASTTADASGSWQVQLKPLPASGEGRNLVIKNGEAELRLQNVVVGDVWHASGQSNMAMTVANVANRLPQAKEDIAVADLPQIRFRRVSLPESKEPQPDLPHGDWTVCSPSTAGNFSAAAFYFARKLHDELEVPIGVIDSSRGGTPIEPFIPREAFRGHKTLVRERELGDAEDLQGIWKLPGGVRARDANWLPGRLYHSRLAPLKSFGVRGVIWYQGESNSGVGEDPRDYRHKMHALIAGWREAFGKPDLPFYFVQLPGSGAGAGWPYLREQQRLSLDLPATGMAVTIDLLDSDIHPPNKIDVGERLARWALANTYSREIPFSGPLFESAKVTDDQIVVTFQHADSGLIVAKKEGLSQPEEIPEGKLAHFELADDQGNWHKADAKIQGSTVVVTSTDVTKPVAVRYAYEVNPQHCHLYNRDGLPASPFCSRPKLLEYQPAIPN